MPKRYLAPFLAGSNVRGLFRPPATIDSHGLDSHDLPFTLPTRFNIGQLRSSICTARSVSWGGAWRFQAFC
jgi:hypothetical protein